MTTNIPRNGSDSNPAPLSLFDHVKRYGQNCAICKNRLKFTDTVYRDWTWETISLRTLRPVMRLLATCGDHPHRVNGHDPALPCENCGRSVSNPTIIRTSIAWAARRLLIEAGLPVPGERLRVFCSERCRVAIKNALYHAKHRAKAPARKCDVCGTTFQGRAGAKTCSAKCRKKRSRSVGIESRSDVNVTRKRRSRVVTRQHPSDVSVTRKRRRPLITRQHPSDVSVTDGGPSR